MKRFPPGMPCAVESLLRAARRQWLVGRRDIGLQMARSALGLARTYRANRPRHRQGEFRFAVMVNLDQRLFEKGGA